MTRLPKIACLAVLLLAGPALAGEPPLWVHVRVTDPAGDASLSVNVPLGLIRTALPLADLDAQIDEQTIRLHGHDLSLDEVKALWNDVLRGPDMEYVTVEEPGETLRVWKEKEHLFVEASGTSEGDARIRLPISVVDALLGGEDRFDVEAAVAALADQGEGELVWIEGEDESIRIWVDSLPEGAGSAP